MTSTSAVTTCIECWQVFSTAEHKQKLSLWYWCVTCLEQVELESDLIEWQMRIWTEVSIQVFEFFFVLISLLQKSLKSPLHFFATESLQHFSKHITFFCNGSVWVCFVMVQLFRSPLHFVSTELSQSCLCFVTAVLSQSPLCFVTTTLLDSSFCLSVY